MANTLTTVLHYASQSMVFVVIGWLFVRAIKNGRKKAELLMSTKLARSYDARPHRRSRLHPIDGVVFKGTPMGRLLITLLTDPLRVCLLARGRELSGLPRFRLDWNPDRVWLRLLFGLFGFDGAALGLKGYWRGLAGEQGRHALAKKEVHQAIERLKAHARLGEAQQLTIWARKGRLCVHLEGVDPSAHQIDSVFRAAAALVEALSRQG